MSLIKGQDWSGYQVAHPSTDGLDFAFTKVTEGLSYINPHWTDQRDWAKSHGLVWGAYHYPHMGNNPIAEADYFLKQVAWKPGDIIVLDWEGYDSANRNVSKATQRVYRDKWLAYVKGKMPGHKVGIYCNTDYWLNVDTSSNCGDFLWIATAGKPAGSPGIKHAWTFHQYSTAGGLDRDVANFTSRAALATWAGQQEESTVALTDADVKKIFDADLVPAQPPPYNNTDWDSGNKTWTFHYALYTTVRAGREANARLEDLKARLDTLSGKVDSLSTGGVDLDALAAKVADVLHDRLAG